MPTIEEEIEALAKKLHPDYLIVKTIENKRTGISPDRTEHVLTVHVLGRQIKYTADSLPLLKADLKRRLTSD